MRKKWGPLIGGILIGFIIMAMRYEKVVDYSEVIPKNDIVYEISTDKPFTGKVEIYFENSKQLNFSAEYKKGVPHGETVKYYENGNIKEKYFYKKGELHGTFESYDEDGKLSEKHKYKNGVMVK